ncbi:hypothetical protein CAEBREN_22083 [Caenorhabditis brenneri]|uniref:F-box associated domain-containing protein n=1 Tax=Caenorhabditis brenneri TaxID=135651 RepID=G0N241_CAEBE|nr:hypothetical protein CAEBREN_22083 [Caenorhabditis brenneri]
MIQSKPKAPVQVQFKKTVINCAPPYWLENFYCLKVDNFNQSPAPWFSPEHLRFFEGTHLILGQSGLRAEDMEQFLDGWLADSHPHLETIILNEFQSSPTSFDKFASSLVRSYGGGNWNRSSTFHLERPSDGRIACVKITRDLFVFVV